MYKCRYVRKSMNFSNEIKIIVFWLMVPVHDDYGDSYKLQGPHSHSHLHSAQISIDKYTTQS